MTPTAIFVVLLLSFINEFPLEFLYDIWPGIKRLAEVGSLFKSRPLFFLPTSCFCFSVLFVIVKLIALGSSFNSPVSVSSLFPVMHMKRWSMCKLHRIVLNYIQMNHWSWEIYDLPGHHLAPNRIALLHLSWDRASHQPPRAKQPEHFFPLLSRQSRND